MMPEDKQAIPTSLVLATKGKLLPEKAVAR
jgi:hypothetical protein